MRPGGPRTWRCAMAKSESKAKSGKGRKAAKRTRKVQGTMALWIMTPFGPIYPAIRPPRLVAPGDPATMVVRARRREYIEGFRKWCPELGELEHNPGGF